MPSSRRAAVARHAPARTVERALQVGALERPQLGGGEHAVVVPCVEQRRSPCIHGRGTLRRQRTLQIQAPVARAQRRALDCVSSSRTLPGQSYPCKTCARGRERRELASQLAREPLRVRLGEQRDIRLALAQRRQPQRKHVQPIIQVLAKAPRAHLGGEVAIGRRDHAHVDCVVCRRPPARARAPAGRAAAWAAGRAAARRPRRGTCVPPCACTKRPLAAASRR